MTDKFKRQLKEGALTLDLEIQDIQLEQLYDYYKLLVEKNRVMNLTGITDEEGVIYRHFIDSLSIVKVLDLKAFQKEGKRAIDVGTGAGFPGLVLKIVFPGIYMILLDSIGKKLKFLDEVIDKLKLDRVETIYGRAETMAHKQDMRENLDLVTSRAVTSLNVLFEYGLPFLRIGGTFVSYKSGKIAEEVAVAHSALELLGGGFLYANNFLLPGPNVQRCLVVATKIAPTPFQYPRRVGVPLKRPL